MARRLRARPNAPHVSRSISPRSTHRNAVGRLSHGVTARARTRRTSAAPARRGRRPGKPALREVCTAPARSVTSPGLGAARPVSRLSLASGRSHGARARLTCGAGAGVGALITPPHGSRSRTRRTSTAPARRGRRPGKPALREVCTAPARSVTSPGLGAARPVSRLSLVAGRSHGARARLACGAGAAVGPVDHAAARQPFPNAPHVNRSRAPGSTTRETGAPRGVHSAGEVRDLAWTRRCAAGFPSVARGGSLPRRACAADARRWCRLVDQPTVRNVSTRRD